MKLAKKFTFVHRDARQVIYEAEQTDTGDYIVSWEYSPYADPGSVGYEASTVSQNIINGVWRVKEVLEVEQSLEVGDDVFVIAAGLPVQVEAFEEPEFLPPDDIEPIPDYGISLSDIRRFVTEMPKFTVEVDADFYVVKSIDNPDVTFTAQTEGELTEVFQAIRTLEKASDRG